jgi:protein phosphatase
MSSQIQNLAKQMIKDVLNSRIPGANGFHPDLSSVLQVVGAAQSLLEQEPAILSLSGEHCVVGDIHGNVDILLRIFEERGYPPSRRYLFLGDYVDRGQNSCEVIILIYSLKVLFPESLHLIRGNHESDDMAEYYGFKSECTTRLSGEVYSAIIASFNSLPLGAILARNFCVHGGISPYLQTAKDFETIPKGVQALGDTVASDLLWSDPRMEVETYEESPRGRGHLFGEEAVSSFLSKTGICDRIIRAHETCPNGFDWPFPDDTVLTLFSSCDYCEMQNDAGIAIIREDGMPECDTLPPLMPGQMKRRRITFPSWALCDEGLVEPPIDLDECGSNHIEVSLCL